MSYCHNFNLKNQCKADDECDFLHGEKPLGICLNLECELCNSDD